MSYKIFLREEVHTDTVELVIFLERDGNRFMAQPLIFEPYESLTISEPTIRFRRDEKIPEQLKQELRIMGLLNNVNDDTLKAKDAHLEDMRKLVFKETP